MDTPPVQFETTPDGTSLAYAIAGEGMPVIHMPFHHSHVALRWERLLWVRGLAEHFNVLYYDSRGQGLSTLGLAEDPTLDDYRCDLETMVRASGFERFALVAYGGFGHIAMRYAVENPERVSALALICSCESFASWTRSAFLDMAEENWDLFLELQNRKLPPDVVPRAIAVQKQMSNQSDYVRMIRCFIGSDVSDIVSKVTAPTLFIHSLDQHWLPPAEGAKIAAKIMGARIVFTDGDVEPADEKAVPEIVSFLKGIEGGPIGPRPSGVITSGGQLSPRQIEVLRLIAEGKRTREIAEALVLSERTVERHIADAYTKIGARNRAEATAFVLSNSSLVVD
jgi:pimeloyl-ACP methyl ester carboxylesterase/DNA-binding CsgD family transcriptional regulator